MVSIEDGMSAMGFRKIASIAKSANQNTGVYYVALESTYSPIRNILGLHGVRNEKDKKKERLREIAYPLAKADIIGFSSMTNNADFTRAIIKEIREINPKSYIVWGGIHPIVFPEDAIHSVNAICVGEGEYPFMEFISLFKSGKDYTGIKNFWFNLNGEIKRNGLLPLNKQEDMNQFPFPLYAEDEFLFKREKGFFPMTQLDFFKFNGLGYHTIWTIGCPYKCSYCSNTTFLKNDKSYGKLRYPSTEYIVNEVKNVLNKHSHVSTVVFYDDSFMSVPSSTLKKFSELWREKINLPFCVMGVIPSYVKKEKMKILIEAGMIRMRMGIQSASDRMLKFYHRPNKPGLINDVISTIGSFSDYMIPPAYDFIVDNPIETRQDIIDTLELVYSINTPFTINPHALNVYPNTVMEAQFEELGLNPKDVTASNFSHFAPTFSNILLYALTLFKPPRRLFDYMLKYVKPLLEKQTKFPKLLILFRMLYFSKRVYHHVRFMDFSIIPGRFWFLVWKLGLIEFWKKVIWKPKFRER
tara:strand:+ start:6277 stop:7854 length:1578 start_codon:yes stop_codon:yes gene_type:complete